MKLFIKQYLTVILTILLFNLLVFLPGLLDINLIINRNNDLSNFFVSNTIFVKNQILKNHEVPFWNNLILSGTPILPDPQSPIFYIPNILFLLLPVETGYIFLFLVHNFFAGLFMFILCRKGFNLSISVSLIASIIYMLNPKTIAYVEAGHYGLFTIFTWIPVCFLSLVKIIKTEKVPWAILLGLSLSLIYFSHLLTFILIYVFLFFIFTYLSYKHLNRNILLTFILSNIIFVGFISIQLLPQLEWKDQTTRFILLENPDTYPKWTSKIELIKASISPLLFGYKLKLLDTEKLISYGSFFLIIAIFGIWKTKLVLKTTIVLVILGLYLIIANNASPFYNQILTIKPLALLRVMSRFWIITYLIIFSIGIYTIGNLFKSKKNHTFLYIIISFCILELLITNWTLFYKPINKLNTHIPQSFLSFIMTDKDLFRVFCLNNCLPQQEAAKKSIETIEGYNTLQQRDYNVQMWQFTGKYWNYYTLSLPPYGVFLDKIRNPDITALGDYNTKYLISNYSLNIPGLIEKKRDKEYYLYQNSKYLPRIYYRETNTKINVLQYRPNKIVFKTIKGSRNIIISNSYNKNWKAYLNGNEQIEVLKTPSNLQQIRTKQDTHFVVLKYIPQTFIIGFTITSLTYFFSIFYLVLSFIISKNTRKTPIHKD